MNYVIGCGGVGSWLIPKLRKLDDDELVVIDGDTFEEKNLDRQLFPEEFIGRNKAEAMSEHYGLCGCLPEFFSAIMENLELDANSILFCCADNHACRLECLKACDEFDCRTVIAANEYTEAEAYWYESAWKNTPNDPRVFYPDILTDRSGDPLAPIGCVEAAKQDGNRQLVIANDWASGLALQLYWFHTRVRPEMEEETKPHWPVRHSINDLMCRTIKFGDRVLVPRPLSSLTLEAQS